MTDILRSLLGMGLLLFLAWPFPEIVDALPCAPFVGGWGFSGCWVS